MPDYIMLCRYTEKGVKEIKTASDRLSNVKTAFEKAGGKVRAFYAVLGQYDTIGIVEAPDDETIARLSLQISGLGNVHVESLRAFNEEQFMSIVKKI